MSKKTYINLCLTCPILGESAVKFQTFTTGIPRYAVSCCEIAWSILISKSCIFFESSLENKRLEVGTQEIKVNDLRHAVCCVVFI